MKAHENLAINIRSAQRIAKMTDVQLCKAAGISGKTLWNIVNMKHSPSLSVIEKIGIALGMSVPQLVDAK